MAGAREVRVSTLEEAVGVLRDGAKHRMTAATLMNQASSRSHSIFMLRLDQVIGGLFTSGHKRWAHDMSLLLDFPLSCIYALSTVEFCCAFISV